MAFLIAAIALLVAVICCAFVAPSHQGSSRHELGLDVAPGSLRSEE
jgi:hypothetical protein